MKLEVGKRYVLRNGEVTGYIHECRDTLQWMTDQYKSWLVNGGHYNLSKEVSVHDIIAEYSEPDPSHDVQQPLRWVENCKPDKPGIWAVLTMGGITYLDLFTEQDVSTLHKADFATRCYLGPIPEILPPKKKVVERLWVQHITHITGTDAQYQERWVEDGSSCSSDWIRTDKTREREQ